MTIRIRNDSTSAVVRGYAVNSHNTLVWLKLAPLSEKSSARLKRHSANKIGLEENFLKPW